MPRPGSSRFVTPTHGDASRDASRGYDRVSDAFIASRSRTIGVQVVAQWSGELRAGARVLDLAAGSGEPLTAVLMGAGLRVTAMDASLRMTAAFQRRFPRSGVACAAAACLPCRAETFDAVLAWGLLFLLPASEQRVVVREVARVIRAGGHFLFTAPAQRTEWRDNLTGLPSISLGADAYRALAAAEGFAVVAEHMDEGDNYYYSLIKKS
jgi:ubiquinone/menaquinone biosynthesis C-methylase UbiE